MPANKKSKAEHPSSAPSLLHYYRKPALSHAATASLLRKAKAIRGLGSIKSIETEFCFNVELKKPLTAEERTTLVWLLAETFEPEFTAETSFLAASTGSTVEIGPRLSYDSPWSTNAVSVCKGCGLDSVVRIERSRRYLVSPALSDTARHHFVELVHDRMTEMEYKEPLVTFGAPVAPVPTKTVPVMAEGKKALEKVNEELGLGFDDWDLDYYTNLFAERMGRDPTDCEVFDMAQSNSEHSRHWFFSGRQVIDGKEMPESLFKLVKETVHGPKANDNSIIAFHDNSSVIRGFPTRALVPSLPGVPCPHTVKSVTYHPLLTAETHNFPSGIAPFPGAETGTGGRIRDVQATGRGAHVIAGISAYCVGSLHIPGYDVPWEDKTLTYPSNMATPLQIEIEASNGASDYGNKFGEPVVCGFTRSFGMTLPSGERREWIKPIMFTAGIGQLDDEHKVKGMPEKGMAIVKVGGPAYRIGLGGGAASSRLSDAAQAHLDFDAVQRGDAEMENKMNRIIRACINLGPDNPIHAIHDQGAGGNGNVLKEICEPIGGRMDVRKILCGDKSMSVREIWGAEYQENNALLTTMDKLPLLEQIAERENAPMAHLGEVTGDGRVVLFDSVDGSTPVDLELALVLGEMPKKVFTDEHDEMATKPLDLGRAGVKDALERVLTLLSVGSKRFLVNKVDRSVSGLIARQQCVGPLHTPLADCAVVAQGFETLTGVATSVGEQPIIGLLSAAAMARMTVAEALTNMCSTRVTSLRDIKASGNWMWAAKMKGEGARMYDACVALRDLLCELGVAVDGGKDSLSMAASVDGAKVKCPGALVFTAYCGVPDVTKVATPDLKKAGSSLLLLHLGDGKHRLGGSSLAHVYSQLGEETPDVGSGAKLGALFEAMQELVGDGLVLAAHDRSDGGLIVAALEMAFAGNVGIELELAAPKGVDAISLLFAEEVGVIVEVAAAQLAKVNAVLAKAGVAHDVLGTVGAVGARARVTVDGKVVVDRPMVELRDVWERTSDELELLQCNPACARAEAKGRRTRQNPTWPLTFTPTPTPAPRFALTSGKPRVAVLREEGSNGDRDMAGALYAAGIETWDVTVSDLLAGRVTLDTFRGVAFVGGFSYADVLDSAKGWAGKIKFNLTDQFEHFRTRPDTFSLGVCNGCQLMALLGWVPGGDDDALLPQAKQPRFVHNESGRFESRYSALTVLKSNAVLLKGMEGSTLGVWVAHGEGKVHFPDKQVEKDVLAHDQAPLRYADDTNMPTETYPFNPNGSPHGIAALCSKDGRHLALMPHPERCFVKWQLPWMPEHQAEHDAAPWLQLFQNAFDFASK
ncbi:hypothetical protein KFE25_003656 [Diacronema lutheri]|uniref:phosphoribosylformylglycinamidine synthase n=2 Tax=Diacronema lutheri TaxID=2081491 RepID=A0A8J5XHI0_DIALT|nr:hypothetical protein KFE25_003656 [Diacronema lutheri]